MPSVSAKPLDDIVTFETFRKEAVSEVQDNPPFFVHVFIDTFPDITAILRWPVIKDTTLFKRISKNLDSICVCIVITSLATGSFSAIGLFYSVGALKYTFIAMHISAQTALSLFSGAYLKKYFLLQRKHKVVEVMVKKLHGLHCLNLKYKSENKKQKAANLQLTTTIEDLNIKFEEQIGACTDLKSELQLVTSDGKTTAKNFKDQIIELQKIVVALKNAPGNLELLMKSGAELSKHIENLKETETRLKEENIEKEKQNAALTAVTLSLIAAREAVALEESKLKEARELLFEVLHKVHRATCGPMNLTIAPSITAIQA